MPKNTGNPRKTNPLAFLYPTGYNTGMTNNGHNAKGITMTGTKRAKVGGEIGKNGEFYAGGTFLPSTTLTKMGRSKPTGTGKVQIEPFVWVVSEGRKSLYRAIAGLVGSIGRDGVAVANQNDTALRYLGVSREQAQEMCDRYNAGERWL